MVAVNPEILLWARETAGFSIKEASKKIFSKDTKKYSREEKLQALEDGFEEPSRATLVKMSQQYRRPLIVFYLDKPPILGNRGSDFRTLENYFPNIINGQVDALIRDIYIRQGILKSAIEDDDEIKPLEFINSLSKENGIEIFINSIKNTISFNLDFFYKQKSPSEAFNYLRNQVEKTGIYVLLIGNLGSHHTNFDVNVFRGFTIADKIAPFIVINDKDSKSAWSFTLIHELTHLWLGQTGISGIDSSQEIEKFCNDVASEFLLPSSLLLEFINKNNLPYNDLKSKIHSFAKKHNVSDSMVAYKIYLKKYINYYTWERLNNDFHLHWLENKEKNKEKNKNKELKLDMNVIRRHRLGNNLISQVDYLIHIGSLSSTKACKLLGIKPKSINNILEPQVKRG